MAEHVADPFADLNQGRRPSKRICIIGAGANGLATLKVFLDSAEVRSGEWMVTAMEERSDIGGVWLPDPATGDLPASPLYDSLTTNIPHPVMAYTSFPFPPETPLFPPASVVQTYLHDYAAHFDLARYIRLNTRVDRTEWDAVHQVWKVTLSTGKAEDFDFLVVANGHFRTPRYPKAPGLKAWLDSGRALHSIRYRRPGDFAHHDKIVVVGGGPSAIDICTDLRTTGKLVLQSIPGENSAHFPYPPDTDTYRKIQRIAQYKDNGEIVLEDGSIESHVDLVILATGYEYSVPFLSQVTLALPEVPPPFPSNLHNSTYHIFPLAKFLFPLQSDFPPHSIAFPGLLVRVAPLPMFEDQARAMLRVLADPSSLDVAAESVALVSRAQKLVEQEGTDDPLQIAKAWFFLGLFEPFDYRAELNSFAFPETPWKAPEWEVDMWAQKVVLRAAWRDVEKTGEAQEWLKDVGTGGIQDWVELCRKLVKRYEDMEGEKSRL
ncbi:FAD/NAD-P-binding domain-containing protein [Amylostereum chailletii]|nr:FAD/NAD-P-binding domain-containing protein [Amylostereum chailletii]